MSPRDSPFIKTGTDPSENQDGEDDRSGNEREPLQVASEEDEEYAPEEDAWNEAECSFHWLGSSGLKESPAAKPGQRGLTEDGAAHVEAVLEVGDLVEPLRAPLIQAFCFAGGERSVRVIRNEFPADDVPIVVAVHSIDRVGVFRFRTTALEIGGCVEHFGRAVQVRGRPFREVGIDHCVAERALGFAGSQTAVSPVHRVASSAWRAFAANSSRAVARSRASE